MSSRKNITKKLDNESDTNDGITVKESKESDKYKIALKLINKILVNIGKEQIDDLTKFVNIDREDIIKDVNKTDFEQLEVELFDHFDKVKCGWYRRKTTKNYILTFMRYMCDNLGYKLIKSQKGKMVTIDGKNYEKTCMIYSINYSKK